MNNLCDCGCGKEVKSGNTYINGHNGRGKKGHPSKLKGKTFVEVFGSEKSQEIGNKIRITKMGDKNPAKRSEVREKISKNRKGKLTGNDNPKYWKGKQNFDQSERMKKNNPLFDPEVQEKRRKFLIEKCEKLGYIRIGVNEIKILDYIENFINYKIIRQFKVKAYSVDGYVKELNICLEVDERHHYDVFGNLKNKDIKRQKIIEESLKCQFIRIKDDELYGKIKENVLKKIIWIK